MEVVGQFSLYLSVIIYIFVLLINRVGFSGYRNKIGALLRIYLLTIGMVISPTINGILITVYSCLYFVRMRTVSKKDFSIIVLCIIASIYIILNTLIIYSKKNFDPEFNPYVGMIEYIIYFIYYILLRTEKYSKEENNLLICHTSLFAIGIFVISILNSTNTNISRMSGIFNSPNLLGIYSAVIFSLVFFNKDLKILGWLRGLTIFSSGIMLIMSFSRVAWLGLSIYLFLFFASDNLRLSKKLLLGSILFVFVLLIMFNDSIANMVITRVLSAFDIRDYSTSDRIVLILAAWDSFIKSPVFGNGIRSFASIIKSGTYFIYSAVVFQPHNAYFEMLQSLGIIGFGLFFLIIFKSVKCSNRNLSERFYHIVIMLLVIGMLNRLFNEFSTTMWFWTVLSFFI